LRFVLAMIVSFGESDCGLPGASDRRTIQRLRRAPALHSIIPGGVR
jgi:hypothetical protein